MIGTYCSNSFSKLRLLLWNFHDPFGKVNRIFVEKSCTEQSDRVTGRLTAVIIERLVFIVVFAAFVPYLFLCCCVYHGR